MRTGHCGLHALATLAPVRGFCGSARLAQLCDARRLRINGRRHGVRSLLVFFHVCSD
jgi:hypothetical protein